MDVFSEFCEMRANEKYNIVVEMLAAIDKLKENTKKVNPNIQFFEVSATSGEGMEAWYEFLRSKIVKS